MKRLLLATLFTLFTTSFSFAQNPPPARPFYRVQVIRTNPGMSAEWQALYKNEVLPALKKAGVKQHTVLHVVQGDVRQFIIISAPLEKWSQLDDPTPLAKSLGPEATQALNTKQSWMIAEWHTYVMQGRPDLGIAPPTSDPMKLGVAVTTTVAPGRAAEYEKHIKENTLPAAQKAGGKGMLVGKIFAGGNASEYRTLRLFDSYDDMAKGTEAFTKARAEMNLATAAPAGVVTHSETLVVRFVPELSIRPEPQKAAK
jgi:hypothetical protein